MKHWKRSQRFLFVMSILALCAIRVEADPVVISGPIVNPGNGHTYYLLSPDTWTASQAAAVSLGGNLVTINDAAEQTWVFGTFAGFGGQRIASLPRGPAEGRGRRPCDPSPAALPGCSKNSERRAPPPRTIRTIRTIQLSTTASIRPYSIALCASR